MDPAKQGNINLTYRILIVAYSSLLIEISHQQRINRNRATCMHTIYCILLQNKEDPGLFYLRGAQSKLAKSKRDQEQIWVDSESYINFSTYLCMPGMLLSPV